MHALETVATDFTLSSRLLAALAPPLQVIGVVIKLIETAETAGNAVLKCVDLCGRELACWDALLEKHVHLGEGAARGLRDTEVRVDDAEEAYATLSNQSVLLLWYRVRGK